MKTLLDVGSGLLAILLGIVVSAIFIAGLSSILSHVVVTFR